MERQQQLLIDTDILIDTGRGINKAINFLESNSQKYELLISIVTYMELIIGCRNKKEQKEVENFLKNFTIIPINIEISEIALKLLKKYRLSSGLLIADSLIAATAIYNECILATKNLKHFKSIKEINLFNY